jgi:PhoH-like ATPase
LRAEEINVQSADRATGLTPDIVALRVVLDTSVLVADPGCLASFAGCAVVVPLTVVEELDGLKTRQDDVGRSTRAALRALEDSSSWWTRRRIVSRRH